MKDYADQLIVEGRNNIYHSDDYIHPKKFRCHGECAKKEKARLEKKYKNRPDESKPSSYYYGPKRVYSVHEEGMWTTITCQTCGWQHFWAAGDGDDWF